MQLISEGDPQCGFRAIMIVEESIICPKNTLKTELTEIEDWSYVKKHHWPLG